MSYKGDFTLKGVESFVFLGWIKFKTVSHLSENIFSVPSPLVHKKKQQNEHYHQNTRRQFRIN